MIAERVASYSRTALETRPFSCFSAGGLSDTSPSSAKRNEVALRSTLPPFQEGRDWQTSDSSSTAKSAPATATRGVFTTSGLGPCQVWDRATEQRSLHPAPMTRHAVSMEEFPYSSGASGFAGNNSGSFTHGNHHLPFETSAATHYPPDLPPRGGVKRVPYTVSDAIDFSTSFNTSSNNITSASCFSDVSSNQTSMSRRVLGINVGGGGALRHSASLDLIPWSLTSTPTAPPSTPSLRRAGAEHLKTNPLRFKMLPSPVPFDTFVEVPLAVPNASLQSYVSIMMRWYDRIEVAQKSPRVRIRQLCPPPPPDVIKASTDTQMVLNMDILSAWASVCCQWWDETARKRGRRGHRGGRAQGGGGGGSSGAKPNGHARPYTALTFSDSREDEPRVVEEFLMPSCTGPSKRPSHDGEPDPLFDFDTLVNGIIDAGDDE